MIKLIAGLGNPGKDYQAHRHNAGFWFIESLANNLDSKFSSQSKFFGETTTCLIGTNKVRLLKPKTFMNNSGQSVKALSSYYNIEAEATRLVTIYSFASPSFESSAPSAPSEPSEPSESPSSSNSESISSSISSSSIISLGSVTEQMV